MSEITHHAEKRGHQRLGLDKFAMERMAGKALVCGLGRPQTHGALRQYFDQKRGLHPDGELYLYGEQVFVFSGNVAITCWGLPAELKVAALGQWRKWRDRAGKGTRGGRDGR